ncbi:RNA polymerase sigma-28 (SigD/FliA/WhiG) subunit [Nocardioides albertanoniae]|uniref:RNA polymerase sigma-28 (SigD/FliA/WhiG) subunit n=1 Tax=Nocardioides albertanoniae TaxID=1175486 RepID=A0A543A4D2_9ACTN|nr:SigB/SigF/SigG family RNA polymerase sigma factor [Nocardioides albertanoniae]TQL67450.1 RNA polymerase sigma-28 (SigD/FliA/WhiG) subunit [Nocardioides albertanoniae]
MAPQAIRASRSRSTSEVDEARRRSRVLFTKLAGSELTDAERATTRDELVHLNMALVEYCAAQFYGRGEPHEDLVQVGVVGLLNAVDRYDLGRDTEFSTYAVPTILGEIKRYFRDSRWAISVPRRLRDLQQNLREATSELTQELGRSPTPRDLAARLGVSLETVIEGLESGNAYAALSLDSESDDASPMLDSLTAHDLRLDDVEVRESIRPVLDSLSPHEKRVLTLKFFRNRTQTEIAAELGVSQMQVSRLLNRSLTQLRKALEED